MAKIKLPDNLKGFAQHGVVFTKVPTSANAEGTCPFCGRARKWYVNQKTLAWDCKRCGRSGGFPQFLAESMKRYVAAAADDKKAMKKLAENRGVSVNTLSEWGVGYGPAQRLYMLPVRKGKLTVGIQRYNLRSKKALNTSGGKNVLFAVEAEWPEANVVGAPPVWMCEGLWDAMVLRDALRESGLDDDVIGLVGVGSFRHPRISQCIQGRDVILALDAGDAGIEASAKAHALFGPGSKSVRVVRWPSKTPDGYDVRDLRKKHGRPGKFLKALRVLVKDQPRSPRKTKVAAAPDRKIVGKIQKMTGKGMDRADVIAAYRKWLVLPDVTSLDVLYGSAFANRISGDPLWMFIVGPPGCGKTELIISLADAPLITTTTTLTPPALISGGSGFGGVDPSLIPQLDGRVLAIKDFTTILKMQQATRDEIFGILRDAFDGRCEKRFGNGIHRSYISKFGFIAGVTPTIEQFGPSHSVLGERFLKYYMTMTGSIRAGTEPIKKAIQNVSREPIMQAELQAVAKRVLNRSVDLKNIPRITPSVADSVLKLSQWTAVMRGAVVRDKYTNELLHKPVAEIGTRLAKQLIKLGIGVAIFRGKKSVGASELEVVTKVARNSVPDLVEEIVKQLHLRRGKKAATSSELAEWTRFTATTVLRILENLLLLRAVRRDKGTDKKIRWSLSPTIWRLMDGLGLYTKERAWARS